MALTLAMTEETPATIRWIYFVTLLLVRFHIIVDIAENIASTTVHSLRLHQ